MVEVPNIYQITSGKGVGDHCLAAFDAALIEAGIGNFNLVRISSIIPPFCRFRSGSVHKDLGVPYGALLPVAYGSISSAQPGVISAAVAIGHYRNSSPGLIMEYSGRCSVRESEIQVEAMVREGFRNRGFDLNDLHIESVEYVVKAGESGAVIAAVPMWYSEGRQ